MNTRADKTNEAEQTESLMATIAESIERMEHTLDKVAESLAVIADTMNGEI